MDLSNEQLEQFKKDGFLRIENFVTKDLCNQILQKAKIHLENVVPPVESEEEYLENNRLGITIRRLKQVYHREIIFKEWMTNLKIRPILKQLLEDTPVLTLAHHNSIMTKISKESSKTPWHQDIRYWNFENDNLISVWLALDNEYLENGLLQFIPKSHKIEFKKEQFDDKYNFSEDHPLNKELIKNRRHNNLLQGDIVLFHCKTLHQASKNNSKHTKISFVYTVRAKSNKAIKNTRSDFVEVILE